VRKFSAFRHSRRRNNRNHIGLFLLAAVVLAGLSIPASLAQDEVRVTGVDPATGKTNDIVTVAGENLGKGKVSAVFLSDEKDDHKASVVSQAADKIVIKVPDVKPGSYNVSIQTGNSIFIQPIRFTVQ
jgi:IPT/TIG domain